MAVAEVVCNKIFQKYVVTTVEIPLSFPSTLKPTSLDSIRLKVEQTREADLEKAEDLALTYLNRIELYQPMNDRQYLFHQSSAEPWWLTISQSTMQSMDL